MVKSKDEISERVREEREGPRGTILASKTWIVSKTLIQELDLKPDDPIHCGMCVLGEDNNWYDFDTLLQTFIEVLEKSIIKPEYDSSKCPVCGSVQVVEMQGKIQTFGRTLMICANCGVGRYCIGK